MKRGRVVGLALTALGVGQIALTLSPGAPGGELLLAINVLFLGCAVVMAWRPEWADGKRSSGFLQQDASRMWFLLAGGCAALALAGLAVAIGSTIGG